MMSHIIFFFQKRMNLKKAQVVVQVGLDRQRLLNQKEEVLIFYHIMYFWANILKKSLKGVLF